MFNDIEVDTSYGMKFSKLIVNEIVYIMFWDYRSSVMTDLDANNHSYAESESF